MRLYALIALVLPVAACSGPATLEKPHPYAEANALMRREIQTRIHDIAFQHQQELLDSLIWLQTRAGETAIPDLVDALKHESPKVRASAAWVLGRIRDRRTIPDLQPLISDKNAAVRLEVARSLVGMGDMNCATILIEGLHSDKVPVRFNCHMALRDATKRDFQYDHLEDDIQQRRLAVWRWRRWWGEQNQDPWFAENYAKAHSLELPASNAQEQECVPSVPLTETQGQQPQDLPRDQPMPMPEEQPPVDQPPVDGPTEETGEGRGTPAETGSKGEEQK